MTRPSAGIRAELEQLLEGDTTRLGDVYRLDQNGLTREQIAERLGVRTSNFVVNQRTVTRAILEGELPSGPVIEGVVAGAIRKRMKAAGLSEAARTYLATVLEGLDRDTAEAATHTEEEQGNASSRPDLRKAVDDEVRRRVTVLVDRIQAETSLAPDDYQRVATAAFALDQVERLVLRQTTGPTTADLRKLDRLDLSIEQAVTDWAADLPLWTDLVSAARGRLEYWRDR